MLRPLLPVLVLGAVLTAFIGVSAAIGADDPPATDPTTTTVAPACEDTAALDADDTADEDCDTDTTDTTDGTDTTDTTDGTDTTDTTDGTDTTDTTDTTVGAPPENHGAAVSAAAHTCPTGPGHGACVSEVARSDAGKPVSGETDDEAEDSEQGRAGRGNGRR